MVLLVSLSPCLKLMRNWKPQPSAAPWVALALLILTLSGALWCLVQLGFALARPPADWPIEGRLYGLLLGALALCAVAGYLGYRLAAAWSLRYDLDRNGLFITWLGNKATIPLSQIEQIEAGGDYTLSWVALLIRSIGLYRGQISLPAGRPLSMFSSRSPLSKDSLLVHTSSGAYAISPDAPESFVQELEQRRRLGAIQQLAPTLERGGLLSYAFWNDRPARWAVLIAAILNLLLIGVAMYAYPGLPELVQLRFDAAGNLAELRPRHQVLFLPLAAATVALLNAGLGLVLYSREPVGARLLQWASILVQILFAVALFAVLLP